MEVTLKRPVWRKIKGFSCLLICVGFQKGEVQTGEVQTCEQCF